MANPRKRKLRKRKTKKRKLRKIMRSGGGAVEITEAAKAVEVAKPLTTKEEPKPAASLGKLEKKVDKTVATKNK